MRRFNRYLIYERMKAGKLSERTLEMIKAYGLKTSYESFEELQKDLLEALRKKKTTRRKLEKFRKAIKESPLDLPLSSTSQVVSEIARKFKLRGGAVVAFLRAHAFKHVPATKRYIRAKRYESPLATRLYVNGMRKKRKSISNLFEPQDVVSAILDGEIAIHSSDPRRSMLALKVSDRASKGIEHDGPYVFVEPPKELKQVFESVTRQGKPSRRLMLEPRPNDMIVLIKRSAVERSVPSLQLSVKSAFLAL